MLLVDAVDITVLIVGELVVGELVIGELVVGELVVGEVVGNADGELVEGDAVGCMLGELVVGTHTVVSSAVFPGHAVPESKEDELLHDAHLTH